MATCGMVTKECYRVAKTHRMPYKLQVIFRKRATNYRVLLRKITYEDKAPYASSPSCNWRGPGTSTKRS